MAKVIFIEFSDNGRPFSVVTRADNGNLSRFDVEYCKRDGCLYADESGSDIYLENRTHKYWCGEGIGVVTDGREIPAPPENRLAKLPEEYAGDWWDWINYANTVYCEKCDDCLPSPDFENRLCDHIRWNDEAEGWEEV